MQEKCKCECHNSNWERCTMCDTHHGELQEKCVKGFYVKKSDYKIMKKISNKTPSILATCGQEKSVVERFKEGFDKEIQERVLNEDNPQYVLGWNSCRFWTEKYCREFLLQAIKEARKEGYEEGLNLRKEYNDPELIKQIQKETDDKWKKKLEKEDERWAESCRVGMLKATNMENDRWKKKIEEIRKEIFKELNEYVPEEGCCKVCKIVSAEASGTKKLY